jgi:hypothetical protein
MDNDRGGGGLVKDDDDGCWLKKWIDGCLTFSWQGLI